MTKKITIISGKGGSGKTSFSLALAKVLSKSGIRVLVVDCDMSTHGATFFMKPLIEKYRKSVERIISVDDILMTSEMPPYGFYLYNAVEKLEADLTKLVPIEENFYFLPSNISITDRYRPNQATYFETFDSCIKEELEKHFDIIIFDCQAGYSDFTRFLTTMSNITVLVTLPDPVSAAANRALCFQIGKELETVQSYQVFNQVTSEEAVSYEKITSSAFFTSLSPMVYSLDVRHAFMRLQIPSYDTCKDFDFNKKILISLFTLFPEYGEQLKVYKKEMYSIMCDDYESRILSIKRDNKKKNKKNMLSLIEFVMISLSLIVSVLLVVFNGYSNKALLWDDKLTVVYLIVVFLFFIGAMCFAILKKSYNLASDNSELYKLEKELYELRLKRL